MRTAAEIQKEIDTTIALLGGSQQALTQHEDGVRTQRSLVEHHKDRIAKLSVDLVKAKQAETPKEIPDAVA